MIIKILEKLRDELAKNTKISSYCTANFSKAQTVFLGQNLESPVGKGNTPALIMSGVEAEERNDQKAIYKISLGVLVEDETIDSDDNVTTFSGFLRAEELRELAVEALLMLPYKMLVETVGIQCEVFPLFAARCVITIEMGLPMRGISRRN